MGQGNGSSTPYSELDAEGTIGAALRDAPPHMQIIYNLLKTSHDSNAAALADNSRVIAETTQTLSNLITRFDELATRVDVVEQNQHALGIRLDADLTAVRADITRANATNRDSLNQRSLEDPREIIVRGIPQAEQLEPLPLSAALLTALKLPHHAPLVVGWRSRSCIGCTCCTTAGRSTACFCLHAGLPGSARRHSPKNVWPQESQLRGHFRCWW